MCRSSGIFVYIFILSLMLPSFLLRAQSLTQTVRGKITEQDSRILLPGVNVVVVGADVFLSGSTNELGARGSFNAPAGMVSGYAWVTGDASANSGKVFRYLC